MATALIIDDEVDLCRLMQMTFKKMNIQSVVAYDVATAKTALQQQTFDFCLTDLRLPDGSGLEIVKLISIHYPSTPVAVITAHGSMDLAIEALKMGAFDFVNKPLELPRLRQLVEHALKVTKSSPQTVSSEPDPFKDKLIGQSIPIQQLKNTIQKLARSQAPVFLWGASGTGKEVVAKLIHELSPRANANFVPVNCGAIPSELMESEFFGHKKGSFTGAFTDKEGLFQQANGGTLFLDEVADLPLPMQVKLLRAIQEKKVRPIGSTQEFAVDVRLLSATHKNLANLVAQGEFRQDLYYRINVIEVKLPSLNERKDDILLLATHFLQMIAKDWNMSATIELTQNAKNALVNHSYSGNVRELRNILERAITLSDGYIIDVEHLHLTRPMTESPALFNQHDNMFPNQEMPVSEPSVPPVPNMPRLSKSVNTLYQHGIFDPFANIKQSVSINPVASSNEHIIQTLPTISASVTVPSVNSRMKAEESHTLPPEGLEEYLLKQEKQLIIRALKQCNWNKTQAAKLLNTSFRSLRYRMKKLVIEDE